MLEPHLNYLNVIALGSVICKQMMLDHFSELTYSIIIFLLRFLQLFCSVALSVLTAVMFDNQKVLMWNNISVVIF